MIEHPAIEKMLIEAIAAAHPKPTLSDMMMAVIDEALHREMSQRAFLIAGLHSAPVPSVVERIALLRSTSRFLDACIHQPTEVAKRLNKKKA